MLCESVCKHWLALLRSPSYIWRYIELDLEAGEADSIALQRAVFLRRRLPSLVKLHLRGEVGVCTLL